MLSNWSHSRIHAVADQEQKTYALDVFLELKKGGSFENLTTLSIVSITMDPILLVALVERAPKLEELNLNGFKGGWKDSVLAEIVCKVSSKRLEDFGFYVSHSRNRASHRGSYPTEQRDFKKTFDCRAARRLTANRSRNCCARRQISSDLIAF